MGCIMCGGMGGGVWEFVGWGGCGGVVCGSGWGLGGGILGEYKLVGVSGKG